MLLMVVTTFTACKKDDPAPAPTPAQLIVGKWKKVTATVTRGSVTISDPACNLDDTFEFTASGSVIVTENTKCDPSEPATLTGTYSLSLDGKTLTLDTEVFNVSELTSTSLKVTESNVNTTSNVAFAKI